MFAAYKISMDVPETYDSYNVLKVLPTHSVRCIPSILSSKKTCGLSLDAKVAPSLTTTNTPIVIPELNGSMAELSLNQSVRCVPTD